MKGCSREYENSNPSVRDKLDSSHQGTQIPQTTMSALHPEEVVSADNNVTALHTSEVTLQNLLDLGGHQSRKAAMESLHIGCVSTFKRICRRCGILRWPDYKNKNECALFQKIVTDAVQGAAGEFGPPSVSSHTEAVGSNYQNSLGSDLPEPQTEKRTPPSYNTPSIGGQAEIRNQMLKRLVLAQAKLQEQNWFQQFFGDKESEAAGSSSTLAVQQTQVGETALVGMLTKQLGSSKDLRNFPPTAVDAIGQKRSAAGKTLDVSVPKRICQENEKQCSLLKEKLVTDSVQGTTGPSATSSHTGAVGSKYQNTPGEPQVEKTMSPSCKTLSTGGQAEKLGSSKDVGNSCSSEVVAVLQEGVPESSRAIPTCTDPAPEQALTRCPPTMPNVRGTQDANTWNIKATYGKYNLVFKLQSTKFAELKEKVIERVHHLQPNSFDIEYEDDEKDKVLIACDDDLEGCLNFFSSLGGQKIRLLVTDKVAN